MAFAAAGALSFLIGCGKETGMESLRDSFGETLQVIVGAETGKPENTGSAGQGNSAGTGSEELNPALGMEQEEPLGSKKDAAVSFLDESGMTLETRVKTPSEYERVLAEEGSFTQYLRTFPVKEAGAKVHLYDGSEKADQSGHAAVFFLPIENYDLQQCADSVMRIYAEYFWSSGQTDRIAFHFTNGFLAEYSKWRDGMRIQVSGNDVSWTASREYDDSYECFVQYLRTVFCYAGTLSMSAEAQDITMEELRPGDVFLQGGSPGHVVLVMDVCENAQGRKAFLLGQGYMPAQEFHLLKNGLHKEDPWYYEEELEYPFKTPGYTFQEGSLKRLLY